MLHGAVVTNHYKFPVFTQFLINHQDLYTRRTVHMLNKDEDGAANRRKRGRPQKRSMDVVKEMQTVGVPEKKVRVG